ncbi:hypothetical protein M9H77_12434 [Catharanthus roseus]|uniref:Uncharacterized protein n=1 Tax=Catharanthus roseus TaxID=4058 RepID=A0ACC0BHF1_CATRO|nr:hypothetical protein M9H77_12434 [Catharanthus roseus]
MFQIHSCGKCEAMDYNLLTAIASFTAIVKYYRCLVTQPTSGANDVEINCFVLELVNIDEQTLFAVDYLTLKGIFFSLDCQHQKTIFPVRWGKMRSAKCLSFNEVVNIHTAYENKVTFTIYFKYKLYVKSHKHTKEINIWPPISPIKRNPQVVVKNYWNVDDNGIKVPFGYIEVKMEEAQSLWVEM